MNVRWQDTWWGGTCQLSNQWEIEIWKAGCHLHTDVAWRYMSWQCWKLERCKWWKVGAPGLIPGEPPRYTEQVWMNAGQCTPTDDGQWGRTEAMSRQYQWLQSWYWGDWGGWNSLWCQRLRWGLKTPEEWTCRCQKTERCCWWWTKELFLSKRYDHMRTDIDYWCD